MGGHVIWSFIIMFKDGITIRAYTSHKTFQIAANSRVGVLLNEYRCARVLQMQRNQSFRYVCVIYSLVDFLGKVVELPACGRDLNSVSVLSEHKQELQRDGKMIKS